MKYKRIDVNGINVFYRECGEKDKPVMVLFHGFPSASHLFRNLMPMLQDRYHLIAPDYPGFGQSESPDRDQIAYTFDHLAEIMDAFLEKLEIRQFYMYVFDYGAPIGFRIALNIRIESWGSSAKTEMYMKRDWVRNGKPGQSTGRIRQKSCAGSISLPLPGIQ